MNLRILIACLSYFYLLIGSSLPCYADITMTIRHLYHSKRHPLSGIQTSTIYVSGSKYRVDHPLMSIICDPGARRLIYIERQKHIYFNDDINIYFDLMQEDAQSQKREGYEVSDTNKTTMLLNHRCRHYVVTDRSGLTRGDLLVAMDVAMPDTMNPYNVAVDGFNMKIDVARRITLLPLAIISVTTDGNYFDQYEATSVSTAPIKSNVFDIPAGYKETHDMFDITGTKHRE